MSHNKSSDDQIAIIIRFAGKMSNMQVAEIAGVSERTVRKYIADYGPGLLIAGQALAGNYQNLNIRYCS